MAVSMTLAGVDFHAIMDHVGWKRSDTALHYIKLKQLINPAGAAASLAYLLPSDAGKDYKCLFWCFERIFSGFLNYVP